MAKSMIPNNIVIFDGVCNFCNSAVNFIIRRDTKRLFYFMPIQSEMGASFLRQHKIDVTNMDTFFLFRDEAFHTKSDAALLIVEEFDAPWRLLSLLRFVPRVLRDSTYAFVARYRYKWFGKRSQCMLPTPEQRERFIS